MHINYTYIEPSGHVEIQEVTTLKDENGADRPSYHRFVISPHDVAKLDATLTIENAQKCKDKWAEL